MIKALLALTLLTPQPVAPPYQPTFESLARHEVPQWFEDAKLGIFVHWGAYAVPAFAPVGAYAEWYWKRLQDNARPEFKQHHLDTYGPQVTYDDFFQQWKADRFDARAWTSLFKEGGAKYYTLVTKHHDGIALWDTKTTDRNTVKYGPHRDFVKELAQVDQGLKRGYYYSMPEWFNPKMPRIGGGWFGGTPPKNWLTGEPVPYTGYKEIGDYVKDHQFPQLKELIDQYRPDVVWCDIGLGNVNNSTELNAYYFNQAAARGQEVAVNNRCGTNVPADFTTPEYSVEPDIKKAKWEASRGIGHSYGYNAEEKPEDYLTADQLIDSFVDVVSKNGNLLLNMGPKADGSMYETQAARVRELGAWLKVNGEAIYGSRYWTQAEDKGANVPIRYTTQPHAFYATALRWPGASLKLTAPVPAKDGDKVYLLGNQGPLKWTRDADGAITVDTSKVSDPGTGAYTFRFARPGYQHKLEALVGVEAPAVQARPGETVTVPVTVANRGDRATTPGTVVLAGPGGSRATATVRALQPHTRVTVDVAYTAPITPGDATLKVTAVVGGGVDPVYETSAALQVLGPMTTMDLAFTNDGISTPANPADGDFDGNKGRYPADQLPAPGAWESPQKIHFQWPSGEDGELNNVRVDGQPLPVTPGAYRKLHLLASAGWGAGGRTTVTVTYTDGSTQELPMTFADWLGAGNTPVAIATRYRFNDKGEKVAGAYVNLHTFAVDASRQVASVTVAKPTGNFPNNVNLHIWALTAEG
ncbi:alpha-L-fucosidase [Nonomuraea sp. NPDC050556]|uniref:alpha-L-fucosidase n=1 Tax=Nonomuraea sp. NPDC050556 TaxID=3364369 RepID=UPI0037A37976